MLIRNQKFTEAMSLVRESLQHHSIAGRLWGELIMLEHLLAKNNCLD